MAVAQQAPGKVKRSTAPQIAAFVWSGTDRKGQKVKGELNATNIAVAKAELRKQGINAKTVKKKPKALFSNKKRITPLDISIFSRQLATMMKAGVPLVQSFDIVADGLENPTMKELVLNIKTDVE